MPRYEIAWDFQGAICTYKKSFSEDDPHTAIVLIGQLEIFPDIKFIVHDFSGIENIPMKVAITTTIGSASLSSLKFNAMLKTAVVTTDRNFERELIYLKKLSQRNVEIFSSIEDAAKWARY